MINYIGVHLKWRYNFICLLKKIHILHLRFLFKPLYCSMNLKRNTESTFSYNHMQHKIIPMYFFFLSWIIWQFVHCAISAFQYYNFYKILHDLFITVYLVMGSWHHRASLRFRRPYGLLLWWMMNVLFWGSTSI